MSVPAPWRSHPTFILATVSICLFTDFFAYGVVLPALPALGHGHAALPDALLAQREAALLAVYTAAAVLFILPAGWLADKMETRQRPLLWALALSGTATLILATGRTFAALMVSRALQGMSSAVVWTVGLAMLDESTAPGRLGHAIGKVLSPAITGHMVAPIVGDELYNRLGTGALFGILLVFWVVNLVLRLLVLDSETPADPRPPITARESDSLLGRRREDPYTMQTEPGDWALYFPVLYCCRSSRVLGGLFLLFAQSVFFSLFGTFIRADARAQFAMPSPQADFLFFAIFVPVALLGPVAGKETDNLGPRTVAITGYTAFVPCLLLLMLPVENWYGESFNLGLCILLLLNGVCLALITPPGFLETSHVLERFNAANPTLFGPRGACAQMYSLKILLVFLGSATGSLVGRPLMHSCGLAIMMAGAAVLATGSAAVACLFVGERVPPVWNYRRGCRW